MPLVATPPEWEWKPENITRAIEQGLRGDVQEVLRRARDEYLPWDKFRWLPLPEGVDREALWGWVGLGRGQRRSTPLRDKGGRPFVYGLPDCVLKLLSQLDRSSGDLIGNDLEGPLPAGERYVISSLMEEAIASSQLEGASTTRVVAKEMLRSGRAPRDRHESMILNNWRTIEFVREQISRARPEGAHLLSPALLREMQAIVTRGTMDDPRGVGQWRQSDDVHVVDTRSDEILHVPPRACDIEARMEALCEFANDDESEWVHPVAKAVMLHFWIGYDHPFVDGNGRTARAVFYWYLLSRGYWLFEHVSISRLLRQAPVGYARAYLYTETDSNDLTYFLVYNLRVVELALRDMRGYLARKQRELARAQSAVQAMAELNERQRALIAHAVHHPEAEYTVVSHQKLHHIVKQTARNDLTDLERRGFLGRARRGRAFVFRPSPRLQQEVGTAPGKP